MAEIELMPSAIWNCVDIVYGDFDSDRYNAKLFITQRCVGIVYIHIFTAMPTHGIVYIYIFTAMPTQNDLNSRHNACDVYLLITADLTLMKNNLTS